MYVCCWQLDFILSRWLEHKILHNLQRRNLVQLCDDFSYLVWHHL